MAPIAPFSMFPVYPRIVDTKLIILAVLSLRKAHLTIGPREVALAA